ncbi:MAG TPA: NUDIX domain-containing protein [Patescibacteria group bacterium]|nr:NUDIX domain-containing protein [Patescibacteria group bacterium]
MNKTLIDKLAYIEIKNKKLLVTLSRGKDTWYIPGGKREQDETDKQALIREVREELTAHLLADSVTKYGVFEAQAHGKPEGTIVRMICYMAKYSGNLQPSSEIERIAYFHYGQKHACSPVDHLIFDDLKKKELID